MAAALSILGVKLLWVTRRVAHAAAAATPRVLALIHAIICAHVSIPWGLLPIKVTCCRIGRRVGWLSGAVKVEIAKLELVLIAARAFALAMVQVIHLVITTSDLSDLEGHALFQVRSQLS